MELTKKFRCLEPEYVKKFRCDGRKCDAKCCRGWQVDIDRKTHEKYKQITDQTMRAKILDSLYWNEPSHTYRMKLDRVSCPLLDGDRLCEIQLNFGEEFLSNTCAEFPRRVFVIDDFAERSLSMTCPIAAELALLDPKPMQFKYRELKTTRAACFFYRSANELPARKFLPTLQRISFEVMQDRRLPLNNRLTILGLITSELDSMLLNGREDQFELVPKVYRTDDYFQSMVARCKTLPFDFPRYFSSMIELIRRLIEQKAIAYYSPDQRVFTGYPVEAFRLNENVLSMAQFASLYEENLGAYREFVLKPFGHVIENYLVHSFFAGIYPCHAPITLLNNYFLFLTLFKLFEFGLISMAAVERENFSLDDLLEFIERFSNRTDHASMFTQIALDFIADQVSDPIRFMSTLIDNRF